MSARLLLGEDAYVLSMARDQRWEEVGRLAGGAQALLPGARPVDEGRLEAAIQTAEDWLMPLVGGLRGALLEVLDPTGRLAAGLAQVLAAQERQWTLTQFEQRFLQLTELATGRVVPQALGRHQEFIADVVLLREIAHHGQVSLVRLSVPVNAS